MPAVEFGDLREPWSVDRRKVHRWLHVLVRDLAGLPEPWRSEVRVWLDSHGIPAQARSLSVTRDSQGGDWRVHVLGGPLEVEFDDLPVWLQRDTPVPVRPPKVKGKAAGGVARVRDSA